MDYVEELLRAINTYDENDSGSQNRLRDLVCTISDSHELKKDSLLSQLIYVASQKMRVFGYNKQNKFDEDPNSNISLMGDLKNKAIEELYRSDASEDIILDKTQKEVVEGFNSLERKRMLVSAPTSYGKTFLMREILYLNESRYNNVLLVFPTIALLRENASTMTSFVNEKELNYNIIKSVRSEIDPKGRNIFVFTPERVIQLFALHSDIKLDFFFYDEIYKIDEELTSEDNEHDSGLNQDKQLSNIFDDNRTRTFRIALYLLVKKVPDYYLAGPNLKREKFERGMQRFISNNKVQVYEINFEPTVRIEVEAHGSKIKENPPIPTYREESFKLVGKKHDRISDILRYISEKDYGKTILYCTTPAKANEYASTLTKAREETHTMDDRVLQFLNHIEKVYDVGGSVKNWSLVSILKKGFAVHHGKLPRYVQTEILEQFNNGRFDVLFCTSTIIEGVNTKARNVVILNPTKGRKQLTTFDIKNIGGRAGRYYHNFVGRIFYADNIVFKRSRVETAKLNFVTYDEPDLNSVDLDNAELSDLIGNNVPLKKHRIEEQQNYLLPREVFEKNRLVPYEHQEKLLRLFVDNSEEFERFRPLIGRVDSAYNFLYYNYLGKVLDSFEKVELVDEHTKRKYAAVGKNYFDKGFKGILSFELERPNGSVDKAYERAFGTLKDIVEYKIPKIISLFESIYIHAAEHRDIPMSGFSLSKASRFYETGVRSSFGEELVEFGFPSDTVRKIEQKFSVILFLDVKKGKSFYFENKDEIHLLLDDYEILLIEKAVKSMLRV